MKTIALFCIFLTAVFATFTHPPHDSVISHNSVLAAGELSTNFEATLQGQYPATVEDPFYFADGKLLSIMPGVDNHISADEHNQLLWIWGIDYVKATSGNVNETPCADKIILQFLNESVNANILFTFHDISVSIPLNRSPNFLLDLPSLPLSDSNGSDILSVNLTGIVTLSYRQIYTTSDSVYNSDGDLLFCQDSSPVTSTAIFTKSFYDSLEYQVESGQPSFFLLRPLVKEQWYKNNRFDLLVPSRRQFSYAEILLDNKSINYMTFKEFNVSIDEYGIVHIVSIPSMQGTIEASNISTDFYYPPIFGEKNFTLLYAINSTYAGLGWHNLTLLLRDDFLGNYSHNESILSRELSFGNKTTEHGLPVSNNARPSIDYPEDTSIFVVIALGGFFILLILILLRPK